MGKWTWRALVSTLVISLVLFGIGVYVLVTESSCYERFGTCEYWGAPLHGFMLTCIGVVVSVTALALLLPRTAHRARRLLQRRKDYRGRGR